MGSTDESLAHKKPIHCCQPQVTLTLQVLLHPLKVEGEISIWLCHMLQRNHNNVLAKSSERGTIIIFQFTTEKRRFSSSIFLVQTPYRLKQISLPLSYRIYS